MPELFEKTCVPCEGGVPALDTETCHTMLDQLNGWQVEGGHHLAKEVSFPDFVTALAFVNQVGALAEEQAHHPDLLLTWGRVHIDIWTHKVNGLTESDFILAAKIDQLAVGD